jgi:putative oxygen-independent coproporphyrinogen III oxidase
VTPIFNALIPLSLYIHIPWCVRKCPYCDFNSHQATGELPEAQYIETLLQELDNQLPRIGNRSLKSIFIGGGTPSLFAAQSIEKILNGVNKRIAFEADIEITMEANPGTIEQERFRDFRHAGLNRLSLGIQSLQDDKLKKLGRIHNSENAMRAIDIAKHAGFDNFNLDIMFGLPDQTIDDALYDINTALAFEPTHFSWYQLTIEPNTLFYHQTPVLPPDDALWNMQLAGQQCIHEHGFAQYEVSAYAQPNRQCMHNRNYWEFGDYLGIGAGAHSKLTDVANNTVSRLAQVKNPRDYLYPQKHQREWKPIIQDALAFEFMLNALRLVDGVPSTLFTERTGLPLKQIQKQLDEARQRKLLSENPEHLCPTELGKQYLNDLVSIFL